jgi:hypothetical protein
MDTRAPRPACPWTDRLRARPIGRAGGLGETKTDVVVPVVGGVPVAVRRAEVPRFVVPGAHVVKKLIRIEISTPYCARQSLVKEEVM